jgi:hypothetical protein
MFVQFSLCLVGVMVAASSSFMAGTCSPVREGVVRESIDKGRSRMVFYCPCIAANDEESIRLTVSEGEMKAKNRLLRDGANRSGAGKGNLSGVILRDFCRSGKYVYVVSFR